MGLWQLIKLFGQLFILRLKPNDIPYSRALLAIFIGILLGLKSYTNIKMINIVNNYDKKSVIVLSFPHSLLIVSICILILIAFVRSTLSYYKLSERWVQTLTALFGVDIFASLLFAVWIFGLSFMQLPLEANSIIALVLILGFVFLLYWQFLVYMHIFMRSLDMRPLVAGLFALVYMLLQHNVADILLNIVVKLNN